MSSQTNIASAATTGPDDVGASEGFLPAVAENLQSYVYLLIDPRTDRVFHVGTGTGDRCLDHLAEAHRAGAGPEHTVIREIEAAGHRVRIDVLRHGLDATTAAVVEAAVIDALDLTEQRDRMRDDERDQLGRVSIGDINARYGARPTSIDPEHPVVLVRIPEAFRRSADRQQYEMIRGWWRAGARRERAQWALAVDEGVVRAVYRIDGWEPARAGNRWGFRGHRDHEMEQRYVHHDVSGYLSQDLPLSLQYVNC